MGECILNSNIGVALHGYRSFSYGMPLDLFCGGTALVDVPLFLI